MLEIHAPDAERAHQGRSTAAPRRIAWPGQIH